LEQANSQPTSINPDSAIIQEFEKRISEYAKIRDNAKTKLPALKSTDKPERIGDRQHELARRAGR